MPEKDPFFSVIILAYQVEEYIEECVKSVLRQTFQDFEIILVNVLSQDRTDRICQQYSQGYEKIKLLKVENRGQMLNRIAGFQISQGKYLLCIDGDDCWSPELLKSVYHGIFKYQCEVVIFGYQRFDCSGTLGKNLSIFPNETVICNTEKEAVYEKLICGGPVNEICMKAMSKDVFIRITEDFSKYGFLRQAEDLLYSCYVIEAANSILYLDLPLYRYRMRENSISHRFRKADLQDQIFVKSRIREFMVKWEMDRTKYYDLFYTNLSRYLADWIYRCATSELSYREKRKLYCYLRKELLYKEAMPYLKRTDMKFRHKMFVILFRYSDFMLEGYTKLYVALKKKLEQKG